MTVPADPREALARAEHVVGVDSVTSCEHVDSAVPECEWRAGRILAALNDAGYTLAARQDEPSPALRDLFDSIHPWRVALEGIARHSGDPGSRFVAEQALAANPPQTREAEGAAPRTKWLRALDREIEEADEQIGRIVFPPEVALQNAHVGDLRNLRAFLACRTPEAQRDAEPPDLDVERLARAITALRSQDPDFIGGLSGDSSARLIAAEYDRLRAGQRDAGNLTDGPDGKP